MMTACFLALPGINMAAPDMNRFVIRHVVCDLGVPESTLDALSGHWCTHFSSTADTRAGADMDEEEVAQENCWDLHTRIGCAAHASHNALKWSLVRCGSSKEVLKSSFVALSSIRNCFGSAFEFVGRWLTE
eukprot:2291873-Amphidinium_carterae.1